jgi:hypothetical protein
MNANDLNQIQAKGITAEQIAQQIAHFKKGFPYAQLVAPATEDDGIVKLADDQVNHWINYFEENSHRNECLKFVPASGAASRMFKHLFEFLQSFDGSKKAIENLESQEDFNSVGYFIKNIRKFAFFDALNAKASSKGLNLDELLATHKYKEVIELLLNEDGMGYANLPKALLLFHQYADGNRLAVEEHLIEAAHYSTNEKQKAKVHFTLSPEHRTAFVDTVDQVKPKYTKQFGVQFEVGYSEQKPSTDTLAVDPDNNPFRNGDNSLLFRPGGHGALIENLNELGEEIIFIKNIDNSVPDHLRGETYRYKKAIGGLLMYLQNQTFEYLDILDSGNLEPGELDEIMIFANKKLSINIPEAYNGFGDIEKIDFLFNKLNRPMRVCGMVKNEGEPGGGPFWVKNSEGEISLQIVESSQIDFSKDDQKNIVANATHFNPVDLVCGMYDFRGNKFDLRQFVDHETGFISYKSKDGRDLKALELPGLWNGAMADWITIFVETPIITFNPVKTVNDLLRPQHQPKAD